MRDSSIYNIFKKLLLKKDCIGSFCVSSLPYTDKHKIGVSLNRHPIFFIQCEPIDNIFDTKLEFISIIFNRKCQLLQENAIEPVEHIYTTIELTSNNVDLQKYFLDIISIMLKQLPKHFTSANLKYEIKKLINLFSHLSKTPQKNIQGLWAELFLITQAKHPEYLIKAWHNTPTDKFDFNDGYDKIEVKSTSLSRRIHNFSIEQLSPNHNSNLLIASVITINTGIGKNIFDLLDMIEKRIKDVEAILRLNEIVIQTMGQNFDKISDIFFDYQQAQDTLSFYNYRNIPIISKENIPHELFNIRFSCDLTHISPITSTELFFLEGKLFKSI